MLEKVALVVVLIAAAAVCFAADAEVTQGDYSEDAAKTFLVRLNDEMSKLNTESTQASWDYESNITDTNLAHQLEVSKRVAAQTKELWKEVIKYDWTKFKDPDTRRQFQKYSFLGAAALSPEKYERLEKVVKDMQGVYGKAKICDFKNATKCDLHLEPEITELFAKSRDPDELKHLWTEWRKASGRNVRSLFSEYVTLSNEAARLNNFTDASQSWLKDYESADFTDQVEGLWQQVRPLYVQLHAYVRRRLREVYGEEVVSKTGPIPAHLLGNVWAQTWSNVLNDTVPYPEKPNTDVTGEMIEQKYTPLKMFKTAEEFFTSLGLSPMPDTFWRNSIIEKPADGRDLICHASAWDFYDGKDFRIKQCTRVNREDLETVHHEMGHIQYYLQYKANPFVYKEGANPGFHEAVGDVMALSVSTPKHLNKIGLLKELVDDQEAEINQLFGMALDKVAFLPFAYLMDQWRWGVFQGKITESDYNSKWWEFREQYQGMQPPTQRTEEDFDPGAKYHIVASVPYIRYFVSFIIQFQFHRSLCIAAGEFDPENPNLKPLHKCDIYQNKKAGELLGNMLKMGSSKPWPDAMEVITGQRKMDAGALLQYFSTLQTWLERENAKTGEYIGWEPSSNTSDGDKVHYYELEEPDDSLEDENFGYGYSYAELVPQNVNLFDARESDRSLPPWQLHPIPRRSAENHFERNKDIIRKYNGKQATNPLEKLFAMSEQQEKDGGNVAGTRSGKFDRGLAGLDLIRVYSPERFRPRPRHWKRGEESMAKPDYKLQQHSPLTKLLSSLRSSLSRPHAAVAPPPPQSATVSKTEAARVVQPSRPESDIMWKAEVSRLQAEKMLKALENPAETSGEAKPDISTDVVVRPAGTSLNPASVNLRRSLAPASANRKNTAKKSYIHYHYNLRTPVYYNMVVIKKPPLNTWIDEELAKGGKGVPTHTQEPQVPEAVLRTTNSRYNDNFRSIKLVPVDRNRMREESERRDLLREPEATRLRRRKSLSGVRRGISRSRENDDNDNIKEIFQIYI